ncbi:MAG: hypothetical protein HYS13_14950 [Planctomycetia bacterium]|nr:hypothetical protein [Planctomycetia bacterium]
MTDAPSNRVNELVRRRFVHDANRAFERLRRDRDAWADELAERKLWDATLADGLADDDGSNNAQISDP